MNVEKYRPLFAACYDASHCEQLRMLRVRQNRSGMLTANFWDFEREELPVFMPRSKLCLVTSSLRNPGFGKCPKDQK